MTSTFTPPAPLQTAVLFLVFNRPDTTAQVFEAIRQAKPPRLYVAADGPRQGRAGEADLVAKVREIATAVNWHCEVKTLFREENLGCKYAVSGAITWFFEQEEQGIILEDDCLPSQSFFWFCEKLLELYKDDMRVGQISGFNLLGTFISGKDSYHFSNFGSIWGWASWRRAWIYYDLNMSTFPLVEKRESLKASIIKNSEYKKRMKDFKATFDGKIDTWDFQWIYARLVNRFLIVIPKISLVQNIGFGDGATHTVDVKNKLSLVKKANIDFPLIHPEILMPEIVFEKKVHERKKINLIKKITSRAKRILFNG